MAGFSSEPVHIYTSSKDVGTYSSGKSSKCRTGDHRDVNIQLPNLNPERTAINPTGFRENRPYDVAARLVLVCNTI